MKTISKTSLLLLLTLFPIVNLLGQQAPQPVDYWDVMRVYDWDSVQNGWLPTERFFYTRNASGQATQIEYEEFDGINYEKVHRTTTYSGPANYDPRRSYSLDVWANNSWENALRIGLLLDANGSDLGNYRESWNGGSWDTTSAFRYINVYNANNQLSSQTHEEWSAIGWGVVSRLRFSYDSNMETDTIYGDAFSNGIWTPVYINFDYAWFDFSQDIPYSFTQQLTNGSSLVNHRKLDWIYSINQVVQTISRFNNLTPYFTERNTNDLDAQGRLAHYLKEDYDSTSSTWEFGRETYHNISYFNHSSGLQPTVIIETRATQINQQVNFHKREFDYVVSDIEEVAGLADQIQVYPNPFSDQLSIRTELTVKGPIKLSMIDALGKQVYEKKWMSMPGLNSLDLSLPSLADGVYHYQITYDGKSISGKLIH